MTDGEALRVLEEWASQTHFPVGRFYKIERFEDSALWLHFHVYLSSHQDGGFTVYGHGSTLPVAVARALEKAREMVSGTEGRKSANMSTNLFENERVQVGRFACGRCRVAGPCFQITGIGPKAGDYVVVHREDAREVCSTILSELGLGISDPSTNG